MEHAACPLTVGLHERRFFQNGFQLRGQVGIFPQDTDGLAAALLHQKGIGFTVSHGTAAQQLSIVVAGGVIGLFPVCHGYRLLLSLRATMARGYLSCPRLAFAFAGFSASACSVCFAPAVS